PAPLYAERGAGARLFDVDGNEFIDYCMAYGPLIHGHAPPAIAKAIQEQVLRGTTFGTQHRGELELARRLTTHVPCAELVCFVNSGTEAVLVALRLARAYTGKPKIVRFEGHYHGWADPILAAAGETAGTGGARWKPRAVTGGQSRSAHEDVLVLPWNDPEAVEQVLKRYGDEIAAVIMEPVLCNNGCLRPLPGYLEHVQDLCRRHGVVLIFDEVITGFRLSLGGAQQLFGVTPYLCVLGKAIAGGLPLSAVGGRREIMRLIAEGRVNHMGTLNGNPVVTAAATATIDLLAQDGGAAYRRMNALTDQLTEGLTRLARKHGIPFLINRVGPVFHTLFTERSEIRHYGDFVRYVDGARCVQFCHALFRNGVFVRPSGLWYVSTAHTPQDVEQTLAAADQAFASLAQGNTI
ncbi:MAG TPA: glutamate-1-semialdehyde 2,1-aminomutase, partial [Limnochordales bacterium]